MNPPVTWQQVVVIALGVIQTVGLAWLGKVARRVDRKTAEPDDEG